MGEKIHEEYVTKDTLLRDFISDYCCVDDSNNDKLDDIHITCTSKQLVIKSPGNDGSFDKSFSDFGSHPSALIVVKFAVSSPTTSTNNATTTENNNSSSNLKERADFKKERMRKSYYAKYWNLCKGRC